MSSARRLSRRSLALAAGLAATASLATAGPALALSASVDGTTLVLRPDAGEGWSGQVSTDASAEGGAALRVSSSDDINLGDGCEQGFGTTTANCRAAGGGDHGGITRIDYVGGEGVDDLLTSTPVPTNFTGNGNHDEFDSFEGDLGGIQTIDGGPGDDHLTGGRGTDHITGGPGDDNQVRGDEGEDVLDGGPGNDYLLGGSEDDEVNGGGGIDRVMGDDLSPNSDTDGDDTMDGGDGNDELEGNYGDDTMAGGAGADTVTYSQRNIGDEGSGVFAALDNAANDGEIDSEGNPVEADNVGPAGDVENLTGPFNAADVPMGGGLNASVFFIGNGEANALDAETLNGKVLLAGGAGNDTLRADFSDDDSIFLGEDGNDTIGGSSARDVMDGGPGVDELNGFGGDDDITGGPGAGDSLNGGDGNDTLRAQDGEGLDRVNCALGADVAIFDYNDVTDELCEAVNSTTPPPAGGGGGGGGGGTTPPAPTTPTTPVTPPDTTGPAFTIPSSNKSLRASKSGVVSFKLGRVAENTTGTIKLKTDGRVKVGKKRKILAIGSKAIQALSGQQATVRIKLNAAARKLLRKNKRIKVQANITLSDAKGNATIRSYKFTVRPAKKKK